DGRDSAMNGQGSAMNGQGGATSGQGSAVTMRGACKLGRWFGAALVLLVLTPAAAEPPAPTDAEPLSLNFQDIDVRAALRVIANAADFNLVASEAVSGQVTLRLKDVPWEQALDLVLQVAGLDQRRLGDVVYVAPAAEIAAAEQLRRRTEQEAAALAPVHTEHIQIGYAKAADIWSLFNDGGPPEGVLSDRGHAMIDERTNAILYTGTAAQIADFRRIVKALDVPVRQVLIESRIITVNNNLSEQFGIRWGGGGIDGGDGRAWRFGGSLKTLGELQNALADPAGVGEISSPEDLVVDLGVLSEGASSLGLGITGNSYLIDLEISALAAEGKAEIMARPKVITADKSRARIESGVEIPYQEASSSGATSTSFKDAVLSLDVTPRITPNNRIILEINVKQDNVGRVFNGVPSINTNEIETEVLIDDGETVVLGGIFQTDRNFATERTPLLGNLPLLGRLFSRTFERDDKQELLIFITPRVLAPDPAAGDEMKPG
ncbi:MAG: type IV pilus secretin PilQ, partial [Gammaproteobacteria bacterium]|nr:type IV pilus secretin PilQ [Gammaproteobacteria bacterium]